ncbi:MAG: NUDIX domain-containing protein [Bacilli bacterium]
MDIKVDTNEIKFKYRVNGVLIVNDKLLVVQIMDNGFFCLPGGHVMIGENSKIAIKREMNEEVGVVIKDSFLFLINETMFTRKDGIKVQELSFFYKIELNNLDNLDLSDHIKYENDEGSLKKLDFRWIPLNNLININFKPNIIIDKLINKDFLLEHFIDE